VAFPPTFTNAWDVTFPPDTQLANLLGQDLRQVRTDVMQRLSLLSGTLANRPTPEIVNAVWGGAGYGLPYFATDTQQLFQWNGAAWVQIIFNGNIVASVNLLAQAAAIVTTNLYVVPAGQNGIYELIPDLVTTVVGTGGQFNPTYTTNNGLTTLTYNGATVSTTILGAEGGGIGAGALGRPAFYAEIGTAITYAVAFNAVTGAPQYNLRLRLRYLG
jgi:hypothetical protein